MTWYYQTVTFLPERRNNEALVARCIKILHGFNYRHKSRSIGVSFPHWCNETVGGKLSFVSTDVRELETLLSQHYFLAMQELEYFDISPCNTVPKSCCYASFRRNQAIDQSTPAGLNRKLKRLEKRANARGEIFDASRYSFNNNVTVGHYHSIQEHSDSSNSCFRLNIQKTMEGELRGDGIFSSYGLANSKNFPQTVPSI